jgi:hypothetical protein
MLRVTTPDDKKSDTEARKRTHPDDTVNARLRDPTYDKRCCCCRPGTGDDA